MLEKYLRWGELKITHRRHLWALCPKKYHLETPLGWGKIQKRVLRSLEKGSKPLGLDPKVHERNKEARKEQPYLCREELLCHATR